MHIDNECAHALHVGSLFLQYAYVCTESLSHPMAIYAVYKTMRFKVSEIQWSFILCITYLAVLNIESLEEINASKLSVSRKN